MKRALAVFILSLVAATGCKDILEPKPVDLLTDDVVLNEPADVANVELGLYAAFRPIAPETVIAGDFTADMLMHNGTFSQYKELGTKQITSANASVAALWESIYGTVYIANFILERLPQVSGVPQAQRQEVTATARFLRGYAYFIGAYTFGGMPLVTTTDIETNRHIARSSKDDILAFVLDDYNAALGDLPDVPANPGYTSNFAVEAALARYYLYAQDWTNASKYATDVIKSGNYILEPNYSNLVTQDFTDESIFEVGYTLADDPGTDANIGLNNLFEGRREIIPSNQEVAVLASKESGDRFSSIVFDSKNLKGNDNGWSVAKYGTADQDNNNVVVFRLGEMYLIRAEARAHLGNVTGTGSAQEDINALRQRANAPIVSSSVSQSKMLTLIENERSYELAFEGHRWYDLVRTGRAHDVMVAFSPNWKDTYEVWPIPEREIETNAALADEQNPGY